MEEGKGSVVRDMFLALAVLTWQIAGTAACAVTMLMTKGFLPWWLEAVYRVAGGMLALVFMTGCMCLWSSGKWKKRWDMLRALLCLTALFWGWKLGNSLLSPLFSAALALAAVLAAGAVLYWLSRRSVCQGKGKGILRLLALWGAVALGLAAYWGAGILWDLLPGKMSVSVAGMFGAHAYRAFCAYVVIWLILRLLFSVAKAEDADAKTEQAAPETAQRTKTVGQGIQAAMTAVLVGAVLVLAFLGDENLHRTHTADRAAAVVEASLYEGYTGLEAENLEKAAQYFALAQARAQALKSIVDADAAESLKSVYGAYSSDPVISLLYCSANNSVRTLESRIRNGMLGWEWYPALLRYYDALEAQSDGKGVLSQQQETLQKELLLQCIAREEYRAEVCLFAEDLAEDGEEVLERLADYEKGLTFCSLFGIVTQYGAEGSYTKEMVQEALELAEGNPDNILLQYIAWQIGSSYQEDNAGHYERTIEAARRFDKLYDNGSRKVEQLAEEKQTIGEAAERCHEYEAALEFYEASFRLAENGEVALACAKIQDRLGNYEQCAQMAEEALEQEPENVQALYLGAISWLKTKNVDKALEAAGKLGDLIADVDRPVEAAEENSLYVCAQYLAMNDSSRWTDYTWQIYSYLNEEQMEAAQSHELLWNYMTAIHQCFMKKNYEEAAQAAENILSLRDDLCMAWYLRGTIAFEQKEFKEALEDFEKAVDCGGSAPAIYFSIANTYDAMEDYVNAYVYARMVEDMLPYQDHGNDVYGISVHNKRLIQALESKLAK